MSERARDPQPFDPNVEEANRAAYDHYRAMPPHPYNEVGGIDYLYEQMRDITGLSPMLMGGRVGPDGEPVPEPTTSGYAISALIGQAQARIEEARWRTWGAYIVRRPPLWTFVWACVYVFLTTDFMRGFRHALLLMVTLAFCVALLFIYFMLAMTVKR